MNKFRWGRIKVDELVKEVKDVLSIQYMVCVLMVVFLGYGFYLTHVTVNVDSLAHSLYFEDENIMLAAERWGSTFWFKVLRWDDYYPCLTSMLGILCFLAATIAFSVLFRSCTAGRTKGGAEILFSCILITYPLVSEIWNYDGCLFYVGVGYLLVALSLIMMKDERHTIVASLFLMLAIAGYESFAAVYVAGVLIVLFCENLFCEKHTGMKDSFFNGVIYAVPLIMGLVLKFMVGRIWRCTLGLEKFVVNTTKINWFSSEGVFTILFKLIKALLSRCFVFGAWYFPISEFLLATVLMGIILLFLCKRYNRIELPLLLAGIWSCNFLLSIVVGTWTGYRTCQVTGLFVAFIFMITYQLLKKKKGCVYIGFIVFLVWLCYIQTSVLAKYSILNYERSEEEAAVVKTVGYEIAQRNTDNKPVIFVGGYQLNDRIKDHIKVKEGFVWRWCSNFYEDLTGRSLPIEERFFVRSGLQSNLDWSLSAFGGQDVLLKLFQYYGFDFIPLNNKSETEKAEQYAKENMECWPKKGYYYEGSDYIIIKLGEID